jgi:SH3-like domain-containing protein
MNTRNYIDASAERAWVAQSIAAGEQRTIQNMWRQLRAHGLA